jgi:hypothetical protein
MMSNQKVEAFVDDLNAQVTTKDIDAIALAAAASPAAAAEAAAIKFCTVWPVTKVGIQYLLDHVFTGGGLSRLARWVLRRAIRVGDALCKAESDDQPADE